MPLPPKTLLFALLSGLALVAAATTASSESAWGVFGEARPGKKALTSRYIENQLQVSLQGVS